jgi:hypothetical protein
MAGFFTLLGALLLSLVVGLLAGLQLADFFYATDELVIILCANAVFGTVAIAVLAATAARARQASAINAAAGLLALLAGALAFLPRFVQWIADHSIHPFTIGVENIHITLELLIPMLLTVLVQWGLVRQRWLRVGGERDLTRWPWVTTVVAGLLILNPLGLAVVSSALQRSPTDFMWPLMAEASAAAALLLVVMAAVECYIRGRILRRSDRASSHP